MYLGYSGETLLGNLRALRVKTICIFGTQLQTTDRLHWTSPSKFPDYTPYEEITFGDGTVPEWSSGDICKKWKNEQSENIEILPLPSVDHAGTLWHTSTIDALARISELDTSKLDKLTPPPPEERVINFFQAQINKLKEAT